jgi:ABC-type polysaccharide/polyol phosphate export permease
LGLGNLFGLKKVTTPGLILVFQQFHENIDPAMDHVASSKPMSAQLKASALCLMPNHLLSLNFQALHGLVFILGAIFWNKVWDQLDRRSTEVPRQ